MEETDVAVVLPALDEQGVVSEVVRAMRGLGARTIVVNNGSRDRTATLARRAGAEVVDEPRRGYGSACLAGLAYLRRHDPPPVVVLADCDGSTEPSCLPALVAPLAAGRADLVLGRRVPVEPGALLPHQLFGNRLVLLWLRLLFGVRARDLSPLRAVRWELLEKLALQDLGLGHPVELLVLSVLERARIEEIDVPCCRRKIGKSKIAGTIGGTLRSSWRMFSVGTKLRLRGREGPA